jgi:hypothetical protein
MGNFYVNHTVRAPQERVVAVLEAEHRIAFVGPTIEGHTVVCDQECDSQDERAILALGRSLSERLDSPVLAVLNHDDDILCYWLFEQGRLTEQHNSCPDYFDNDYVGLTYLGDDDDEEKEEVVASAGAAGESLCRAFGKTEALVQVQAILTSEEEIFAMFTHRRLLKALGLPAVAVGSGYRYVAEGDAELDPEACVHVGAKASSAVYGDFGDEEVE